MTYWTRKGEVLKSLNTLLQKTAPADIRDDLQRFTDAFFKNASPADIAVTPVEDLYALVHRAWAFSNQRRAGEFCMRIENPDEDGPAGNRTAITIINDDMPFLVDSVTSALTALGIEIHQLFHPILLVARDKKGLRQNTVGLAEAGAQIDDGYFHESVLYFEVDRRGPNMRERMEEDLRAVLSDVRAAVGDWRDMLDELRERNGSLENQPPSIPADELDETVAFLRWLADNHFTLLGYRHYKLDGDLTDENFTPVPGKGLGILRDPDVIVWRGAEGFTHFSGEMRHFLLARDPIMITKANVRSKVHRRVHLDFIAIKEFNAQGRVIGEHRFVGLFTSGAYSRQARAIPLLRRKVAQVAEKAGFDPRSHAGKALVHILETFPRDELFQISVDDLFEAALGILYLHERPRSKVFFRKDLFERFVSALAYIPREYYDGEMRMKVANIIAKSFNGTLSSFYVNMTDDVLARIHYIIRTTPGTVASPDQEELDLAIAEAVKGWHVHFREALIEAQGEDEGRLQFYTYGRAFSAAYREQFEPHHAVVDLDKILGLVNDEQRAFSLYRMNDDASDKLRLKIYRRDNIIPLSDCLPMLENLGLKVIEEFPYNLAEGTPGWIHDFLLHDPSGKSGDNLEALKEPVEDVLAAICRGVSDDDGFNALILRAGLNWVQVNVLRAYGRYLRQLGLPFSQDYVEDCLVHHGAIAAKLFDLFEARFNPKGPSAKGSNTVAMKICEEIEDMLESVTSLDQDRILRNYLNVIEVTLRTNFYQRDEDGNRLPYLALKIASAKVNEMPKPAPHVEVFVYAPRVEGVHLRGGKVARGGLRWSDRKEDYRTEILGLVKAQMVKNAVIVPAGAKGGFVPRLLPEGGDRDAIIAEGIEAYKVFISGILELTDNLVDGKVVPPKDTLRHDEDDPYLVVAADKGTATFSDIANGVSENHGFWLDDAFASGGSNGYDHKKMGITAKGAWVSVQRHFREMGINTQEEAFTVVGVGDMSGDVFGNGMLLSKHIKLVAAFDHRHIFIDPDPDPAASFKERKRMFNLARSSWMDYKPELISKGGGVFDRSAKVIELTSEIQELLDIEKPKVTPFELMQAILRSRTDLLWFGGIGTYIKAAHESHGDVGDRANDALRINANELRVKVVGEGANLGITQAARIDFARRGGRVNTDFIDNSAGVDCSDNEVNLKIALNAVVQAKTIGRPARDKLLLEMTDEVSTLVLRDNYLQTQAISMAEAQAVKARDRQALLMRRLEREGRLDRDVEGLPSEDALLELANKRLGLTRPEISVLLAYAKIAVFDALIDSKVVDQNALEEELFAAFPQPVQDKFPKAVKAHRLRREIIATKLANALVNRGGLTLAFDLDEATGLGLAECAAAFMVVRDVFDMRALWRRIDQHDYRIPASIQTLMHLETASALRRQMLWFLNHIDAPLQIDRAIKDYHSGVEALLAKSETLLSGLTKDAFIERRDMYREQGVPKDVSERIAALDALSPACDIVKVANDLKLDVCDTAKGYFNLSAVLGFDWLRDAADKAGGDDHWDRLAASAIMDDLADQQYLLTYAVLKGRKAGDAVKTVKAFAKDEAEVVARARNLVDEMASSGAVTVAKLGYATRQLRAILGKFQR